MPSLSRTDFIEHLNRCCVQSQSARVLACIEINNAVQVVRLIDSAKAEAQLIDAVEHLIVSSLTESKCEKIAKVEYNQFGIVLNHTVKEALAILESLSDKLDRREFSIGGRTYYPKVMIGMTPLTPEYRNAELAISAADEALYQARRMGNSTVKLLLPDDVRLHRYLACLRLLPVLREALLKKKFVFYAQPIVPIMPQHAVPKAEVLLRYKAADGRILPPGDYLRTAGLFNVSREVDLYVLEHCCRFLTEHNLKTVFSINISGATVRYHPFFDRVKHCIRHYGIEPERICFEITENVADLDYEQASLLMFRLKNELGCQLSLDDIGIGSSNLANLPKYNVDYFKIDGSFVHTLLDQPYSELVVSFIDASAKMHRKHSIAEYVELPLQLQKLQTIGVHYAQGYLTGKPEMLFDPSLD